MIERGQHNVLGKPMHVEGFSAYVKIEAIANGWTITYHRQEKGARARTFFVKELPEGLEELLYKIQIDLRKPKRINGQGDMTAPV